MSSIIKYILAGILSLLGLFYAVLPHSMHINSGIGLGLSHAVHIAIGVVLIIVAIIVFVKFKQ